MHRAHGSAHDQPHVLNAEMVRKQSIIGGHHVVIAVMWKVCAHAVAGLGRFPVADAVGQNNEVFLRVERLIGTEQLARESGGEKPVARSSRSVHDQNRRIRGISDRGVVNAQFRQRLAARENENRE